MVRTISLDQESVSKYAEYLKDESRLSGNASSIVFPDDIASLAECVKQAYDNGLPLVPQGARTGLCGGAVPSRPSSCIIALDPLNGHGDVIEDDGVSILVDCGLRLGELRKIVQKSGFCFPPDPSEETATIGGLFSNQAKGMNAGKTGPFSSYVDALTFLLYDGSLIRIKRGECLLNEKGCVLPDGRELVLNALPKEARFPFLPYKGEDLIDLLAGSEGTYGIAVQFQLRLTAKDPADWCIYFFFPDDSEALRSAELLRVFSQRQKYVTSLDYLSKNALSAAMDARDHSTQLEGIPELPADCSAALLMQLAGPSEEVLEEVLMSAADILEAEGFDLDNTWVATDPGAVELFHAFRHAVPETLNTRIDQIRVNTPAAYRTSLDLRCEPEHFVSCAQDLLTQIGSLTCAGFVYGHVTDGRIHIDMLPKTVPEQNACSIWFNQLSKQYPIASENGVGKLKRDLLAASLSKKETDLLKSVKNFFDPKGLWNPDSLIPD